MQVFFQPRNPGQPSARSHVRTSILSYGYQNPNARRIFREKSLVVVENGLNKKSAVTATKPFIGVASNSESEIPEENVTTG